MLPHWTNVPAGTRLTVFLGLTAPIFSVPDMDASILSLQWEQWRNNSDALVAGPIPAGE